MFNWSIKSKNRYDMFGHNYEIVFYSTKSTSAKSSNIWLKLITGAIIGFVNGFWGGGGGMVCVPLLQNVIGLPEKKSHATTLLIMLPLSIASLVVYLINGNIPIFDSIKIGTDFIQILFLYPNE